MNGNACLVAGALAFVLPGCGSVYEEGSPVPVADGVGDDDDDDDDFADGVGDDDDDDDSSDDDDDDDDDDSPDDDDDDDASDGGMDTSGETTWMHCVFGDAGICAAVDLSASADPASDAAWLEREFCRDWVAGEGQCPLGNNIGVCSDFERSFNGSLLPGETVYYPEWCQPGESGPEVDCQDSEGMFSGEGCGNDGAACGQACDPMLPDPCVQGLCIQNFDGALTCLPEECSQCSAIKQPCNVRDCVFQYCEI